MLTYDMFMYVLLESVSCRLVSSRYSVYPEALSIAGAKNRNPETGHKNEVCTIILELNQKIEKN